MNAVGDYYDLLAVDPAASKEEIRAAYRTERDRLEAELEEGRNAARRQDAARRLGELHRAWAVLSDPLQRDRYDAARARGEAEGDAEAPPGGEEPPPPPPPPPRRAGGRPLPEPTVTLPAGMRLADGRTRALAALFDLSVLALVYLVAVSVVLPAALAARYPERVDRLDAIEAAVRRLDDRRSELRARAGAARARAERAERAGRDADAAAARQQARVASREAQRIEDRIDARQEEARDIQGAFLGLSYLVAFGILVVCLAYLVPSTVLTGQTLGKRLRRLWVVQVDGRRASVGRVTIRYLLPVALAVFVPQLGLVVALGVVGWALRDRNRQGLHDRLAGTLVVDRPPVDR